MFSDAEIRAATDTSDEPVKELTEKEKAIKRIGPEKYWSRCFECGILSNATEYRAVDWEPKAQLEYHSSNIWKEKHSRGKFFCTKCHAYIHRIEGEEIQRRIERGEMEDPALKEPDPEWPVVPGLTRKVNV